MAADFPKRALVTLQQYFDGTGLEDQWEAIYKIQKKMYCIVIFDYLKKYTTLGLPNILHYHACKSIFKFRNIFFDLCCSTESLDAVKELVEADGRRNLSIFIA